MDSKMRIFFIFLIFISKFQYLGAVEFLGKFEQGSFILGKTKPNSKVKKGDVLLSLEAMKMEYSIKSPRDGIIEKILIKDGQQVTEKMNLIILKK